MKFLQKIFATVLLIAAVQMANAQYCGNSGPSVCTAGTNLTSPGFSPPADSVPCAVQGVAYSQVLQVKVPTSVTSGGTTYPLNWIKIDSIQNLPCGLCWATDAASNQFNGGSQFCVKVTGTTYDNPGQFLLRIIVDVNVQTFIGGITQANQNASQAGLIFYVRVQTPTGSCAPIDTTQVGNTSIAIGPAPSNGVTAGGALTFCQGGSVTFTATQTGAQYQWNKGGVAISGATGRTYTATTAGAYTVDVIEHCMKVTSVAQTVVVNQPPTATISPVGPVVLCGGGTQLLTATVSGGTKQWYNGAATVAGQTGNTYTATVTGNYYVVATQNGCTDTSNKVNVQITTTSLTPIITASRTFVCPSGADTLDVGVGYSSYLWSPGGATVHAISITTGGTYTVTVHNGSCTGTATINIATQASTPTPTITVTGSLHMCGNDSVILTSSAASNNVWSNSTASQSITEYSAGIFTVTTSGPCGTATSAPDTVTKSSYPSLSVGTDTGGCTGTTVYLNATTTANSIVWSNGPTGVLDSVTTTGEIYVVASQGGCSTRDSIHVTFSAPPTATFTNNNGVLTAAAGATSYQWFKNGVAIAGATSNTYNINTGAIGSANNYKVQVSNGFCSVMSASSVETVTGLSDISQSLSTRIYPNPTNKEVTIAYSLSRDEDLEITLTDMTGRVVSRLFTGTQIGGTYEIVTDMAPLTGGIYLINFKTPEGVMVNKIIKE